MSEKLGFKSLFFTITWIVCIHLASAQIYPLRPDRVPEKIKKSFTRNYKNVTMVAWMMEGQNYTAIFKDNGRSMTVCFDPKGNAVYRYFAIPRNTIPKQVWKSAEKQKVETYRPDGFGRGLINQRDSVYVIEGQKAKERLFLFINDDGKLLKRYTINVDVLEP
ncbi:MAG: hypothetical protein ACK4GL_08100 [Flavobacteriales bacterium]